MSVDEYGEACTGVSIADCAIFFINSNTVQSVHENAYITSNRYTRFKMVAHKNEEVHKSSMFSH